MTTNPFRLKALLSVFAIFAVLAIAVACSGDDDDDDGGDGGAISGKKGGEITIQYVEFQSFDPHFSSFAQDIGVQRMVWRGLYRLDKDLKPQPEMAGAAPQISADGKTYTVKLKAGLKWSDGQPLTAKDFYAGFERTCNPDNAGEYQSLLSNVVGCDDYYGATKATAAEKTALKDKLGVKAVDDTTLEVKLQNPQASFVTIMALWLTFPVPSHIVKSGSDKWPEPEKLAFNGPFKVQSYKQKDSIVLVRNDNFTGAAGHTAYLDKITMKFIDKLDVANNAYRNNELLVTQADLTNLAAIKADSKLSKELLQVPSPRTRGIHMNLEHKPLDNPKVRLAISQAVDRKTLVQVAFNGGHTPTTTWMRGSVAGGGVKEDTFKSIDFNVAEAKKNLADAGFADGKGVPKLTITVRDAPDQRAVAEFIQKSLKTNLNIDIEIQVVDGPTRSKIFREETFDLYPGGWSQDYPDPENWVDGLFNTGGSLNHYNCSDPKIDELFKAARFNTNDEQRRGQYREINKLISEGLCGTAVMYHESQNYLISPKVKGFRESAGPQDAWLVGDWNPEEWSLK